MTLPVLAVAVVRAPSSAASAVVAEILHVPYMTTIAVIARLVAVAMSVGIVLAMARLAEEVRAHELRVDPADRRARQAGWCVAAAVGVNASLTYYGKTSNLDVPYLFWASWAMVHVARAVARNEPRRLRRAFVLAALAAATKDQAYAMFLVSVPVLIAAWWIRDRALAWKEIATAAVLAAVVLLLVDGALVNPSGFRARLAFLSGSASQDYVAYTADWSGRVGVIVDAARQFRLQYPAAMVALVIVGLARSRKSLVALWPLLVGLSFTIAFNWTARRTDARFLLPQAVVLGFYGGIGLEALAFAATRRVRLAGQALASVVLASGIFACMAVDANLLRDPRYEAEAWLAANVAPGDTIETYGLNVYLPRFPATAHVIRVGPEPVGKRNPMPGIEEVEAPFEQLEQRSARWVVVSTGWIWRWFRGPMPDKGRLLQPTVERTVTDEPVTRHFRALLESRTAFPIAHESNYDDRVFPRMDVHGTSGRSIWIYRRR